VSDYHMPAGVAMTPLKAANDATSHDAISSTLKLCA
jgi:hypothetical protein